VRSGEEALGQHVGEERERGEVEAAGGVRVDSGGIEDGGRVRRTPEERDGEVEAAGRGVGALEAEIDGFVAVDAGTHRRGVELAGAARGRAARQERRRAVRRERGMLATSGRVFGRGGGGEHGTGGGGHGKLTRRLAGLYLIFSYSPSAATASDICEL